MEQSVAFVPKLIRILRARGMAQPSNNLLPASNDRFDFESVERELGCSLPADYKALIVELPPNTEWGLDPFGLLDPPEIIQTISELRKAYSRNEESEEQQQQEEEPDATTAGTKRKAPKRYTAGVELDWSADTCFVPFGRSASAFYIGWIKKRSNNNKDKDKDITWKVVKLDGENSLAYKEEEEENDDKNQDDGPPPLVELLYRMVVRAVTQQVWEKHKASDANYFWHSDEEAEELDRGSTKYARDGSQDHAATTKAEGSAIYVFGRPVVFVNGGNDDDDDNDGVEDDLPTKSVFEGASEEDFLGVGVYNVTHPTDAREEIKAQNIKRAPREAARLKLVDVQGQSPRRWLDDSVVSLMDASFHEAVQKAALMGLQFDVSDMAAAIIVNGKLAVTDPAFDFLMCLCKPANDMLDTENGEVFVQVGLAMTFGVALTSTGRVLQWKNSRYGNDDGSELCHWVSLAAAANNQNVAKVCAGETAAAAILEDGSVLYWGNTHFCHATRPEGLTENDPILLPNLTNVVDVSIGGRATTVLHVDGTVSVSSLNEGLRSLASAIPAKIVCLYDCGDHQLFVAADGTVYGCGDRGSGQLPIAVTPESLAAYEVALKQYQQDIQVYEAKVDSYRQSILHHCKTLPDQKEESSAPQVPGPFGLPTSQVPAPPGPFGLFGGPARGLFGPGAAQQQQQQGDGQFNPEAKQQEVMMKLMQANIVNGVHHTPESTGAPPKPPELERAPIVPQNEVVPGGQAPSRGGGGSPSSAEQPTLLTVGPEQGRLAARFNQETDLNAWNCVRGPYGLPPGSFAPVIHATGGYRHSVFLHQDGTLSGTGECSGLPMGFDVPKNLEGVPLVGYHVRTGGFVTVYQELGMPAAVPTPQDVVCVKACRGGGLAVDSKGALWVCGDHMGSPEPTGPYVPLQMLTLSN